MLAVLLVIVVFTTFQAAIHARCCSPPPVTPRPSRAPTPAPSRLPSAVPTRKPSIFPTPQPTKLPSPIPTRRPTRAPTIEPTEAPSEEPTYEPSQPTSQPSSSPTTYTPRPTAAPTIEPTWAPIASPTLVPTAAPSIAPSRAPSALPTVRPTASPSSRPTLQPTRSPTLQPTRAPSIQPSLSPSADPTVSPSSLPSEVPSAAPSISLDPTVSPTAPPTMVPTSSPTCRPTTAVATTISMNMKQTLTNIDGVTFRNNTLNALAFQTAVAESVDGLDSDAVTLIAVRRALRSIAVGHNLRTVGVQALPTLDVQYVIQFVMEELGYHSPHSATTDVQDQLSASVETDAFVDALQAAVISLGADAALLNVTTASPELLSTLVEVTRSAAPTVAPTAAPGAQGGAEGFASWPLYQKVLVPFFVILVGLLSLFCCTYAYSTRCEACTVLSVLYRLDTTSSYTLDLTSSRRTDTVGTTEGSATDGSVHTQPNANSPLPGGDLEQGGLTSSSAGSPYAGTTSSEATSAQATAAAGLSPPPLTVVPAAPPSPAAGVLDYVSSMLALVLPISWDQGDGEDAASKEDEEEQNSSDDGSPILVPETPVDDVAAQLLLTSTKEGGTTPAVSAPTEGGPIGPVLMDPSIFDDANPPSTSATSLSAHTSEAPPATESAHLPEAPTLTLTRAERAVSRMRALFGRGAKNNTREHAAGVGAGAAEGAPLPAPTSPEVDMATTYPSTEIVPVTDGDLYRVSATGAAPAVSLPILPPSSSDTNILEPRTPGRFQLQMPLPPAAAEESSKKSSTAVGFTRPRSILKTGGSPRPHSPMRSSRVAFLGDAHTDRLVSASAPPSPSKEDAAKPAEGALVPRPTSLLDIVSSALAMMMPNGDDDEEEENEQDEAEDEVQVRTRTGQVLQIGAPVPAPPPVEPPKPVENHVRFRPPPNVSPDQPLHRPPPIDVAPAEGDVVIDFSGGKGGKGSSPLRSGFNPMRLFSPKSAGTASTPASYKQSSQAGVRSKKRTLSAAKTDETSEISAATPITPPAKHPAEGGPPPRRGSLNAPSADVRRMYTATPPRVSYKHSTPRRPSNVATGQSSAASDSAAKSDHL